MEYFEPNFVDEALVVLDRFADGARVLAGGTLLGPRLRQDPASTTALVNVKRIQTMADVALEGDTLRVGALATAATLSMSSAVAEHAPLVAYAASTIGAPALRSAATIGGNLLYGHHAADLAVALLACNAVATIATLKDGRIELPVERILSPGFDGLPRGALLVDVAMRSMARAGWGFEKAQRRAAFEMAVVSAAVVLTLGDDDVVETVRIALGGAAPTAIRAVGAEAGLVGARLDKDGAARAGHVAASVDAEPADDTRAGAAYRRHLVSVLVRRALQSAIRTERPD